MSAAKADTGKELNEDVNLETLARQMGYSSRGKAAAFGDGGYCIGHNGPRR